MILVDTSIWIDHFAKSDTVLAAALDEGRVLGHPFVIGEVALGSIPRRRQILRDMRRLPLAEVAQTSELLEFIERSELFGVGVGYVDAHLVASAYLTPEAMLWTRDTRLRAVAVRLGIAADLS